MEQVEQSGGSEGSRVAEEASPPRVRHEALVFLPTPLVVSKMQDTQTCTSWKNNM